MDLLSRYRGALLGLAVGDALGAAVEFSAPGTFRPVDGYRGGGPFGLQAGYWTDDTSMALCLAESLIECKGFDACDQMKRYCRWYRDGHLSSTGRCFDIGNTTASALRRFEKTGEPYSGSQCTKSAGNGSLMRLAPVVLFYAANLGDAITRAGQSSRITHAATAAVDACHYFAALLTGVLRGESKQNLFVPERCFGMPLCEEIREIAAGSFRRKAPPEIRGTGYVVESLEAALWAFWKTDTFEAGALAAVNLGDDADTTGAVYGQIAGAYYGIEGIPSSWQKGLAHRYMIEGYALRLFEERAECLAGRAAAGGL